MNDFPRSFFKFKRVGFLFRKIEVLKISGFIFTATGEWIKFRKTKVESLGIFNSRKEAEFYLKLIE